jgi:excisionase family DNA binding protein
MSEPAIAEIRAEDEERSQVRAVRDLVGGTRSSVRVKVDGNDLELPRPLVEALVAAAASLGDGDTIAVVNAEAEVSPAQAAKLLGVSRQFVDRLVAKEVLPARRLPSSSYRKIPVRSVLAYKAVNDRKRAGIRKIVDDAAAAGLTY